MMTKQFALAALLCSALVAASCLTGCKVYKWAKAYPQDNVVEEVAEEAIEHYTGWDIDLTPFSEEE